MRCSVCDREVTKLRRGMCNAHYERQRLTGDALADKPVRAWGADDVGYGAVHVRLRRTKGHASTFACVQCGDQAEEWAYMGGSSAERQEKGLPYSTDLSTYQPMCKRCHRAKDKRVDVCPSGHPLTPENLDRQSLAKGWRRCVECRREKAREAYARGLGR